jgi:hypothetical protein
MIPILLTSWTLPLGLQTGGYFLYVALIAAGSWHWYRNRPPAFSETTAPVDSATPSDEPDQPPPPDSSPAEQ